MSEPTCLKCKETMPADAELCPHCGEKGSPQHTPEKVEGENGVYFCYRHKREKTRLRCGRCARAICTDCTVIGPAGSRCPECSRNKTPVRARGVLLQLKFGARNLIGGPMRFLGIIIVIGIIVTTFRSCGRMLESPQEPDFEYQDDAGIEETQELD